MSKEKNASSPMKKETKMIVMSVTVLAIIVSVSLLLPNDVPNESAPTPAPLAPVDALQNETVVEGCEMVQTLTYTRCEHEVKRRVSVPVELYGKTRSEVEAMYPQWQITSFGEMQIDMEQKPDLFCPAHQVLMTNEAGKLCIFENKYGDALALVRELSTQVSALPESIRDELTMGKGFDSLEALEAWLESVES